MSLSNVAVHAPITWTPVCAEADLVAQSGVVVWHEGAQVALFHLPGAQTEVYALDNRDPQSGANVIGRGLIGSLKGELVVASPLYKQHYSLRDGRCLEDDRQALRTWAVRLNEGRVEIGN